MVILYLIYANAYPNVSNIRKKFEENKRWQINTTPLFILLDESVLDKAIIVLHPLDASNDISIELNNEFADNVRPHLSVVFSVPAFLDALHSVTSYPILVNERNA